MAGSLSAILRATDDILARQRPPTTGKSNVHPPAHAPRGTPSQSDSSHSIQMLPSAPHTPAGPEARSLDTTVLALKDSPISQSTPSRSEQAPSPAIHLSPVTSLHANQPASTQTPPRSLNQLESPYYEEQESDHTLSAAHSANSISPKNRNSTPLQIASTTPDPQAAQVASYEQPEPPAPVRRITVARTHSRTNSGSSDSGDSSLSVTLSANPAGVQGRMDASQPMGESFVSLSSLALSHTPARPTLLQTPLTRAGDQSEARDLGTGLCMAVI